MAATEAQLCNVALARTGQRQLLDSLEEPGTPAQLCKALYPTLRDALLEAAWWKFATRRSILTATTSTRDGWAYVYPLPADCLLPRYLWPGKRNPRVDQRIPFQPELSDDGTSKVLLADVASPVLVYTARVTAVSLFSALFADALAWRLAVDLCLALPVKPGVAKAMADGHAVAWRAALARDATTGQEDTPPDSELISARGSASALYSAD